MTFNKQHFQPLIVKPAIWGDIILKEGSYKIIGICMEVYRELGMGFKEIVYLR